METIFLNDSRLGYSSCLCYDVLLLVFLGAEAGDGQEEDQGDVHHDGQDVAGGIAKRADVLEAEEDHRSADNTHEGTTGDEARCQEGTALLASIVDLLILAAAADEPADDGADEQRGIELQGNEHTQREGQGGHLQPVEQQGEDSAHTVE